MQVVMFLLPSRLAYMKAQARTQDFLELQNNYFSHTAGTQRLLGRKCLMLSTATAAWISNFSFFREPVENEFFCKVPTTFYLSLGSPFQQAAPVPDYCQSHPLQLEMPLCQGLAPRCPQGGSRNGCTEQEGFVLLCGIGRNLGRSWFWPEHQRGRL